MVKLIYTILVSCLFVSVAALSNNAAGAKSFSELTGKTAPSTPQRTVRVRLEYVETKADLIDSPVADSNITIQAGSARFEKRTNKDGIALFDAVPCGGKIDITVRNEGGDENTVFHRRLSCVGRTVNLGVINSSFGGKLVLTQRKTRFIGYDPVKGVWRTKDGRIVPNRVIRRI